MSFDVFLQCHEFGSSAGIPRAAVRRLFPVDEARSGPDYWHVEYDKRNTCTIDLGTLESNEELLQSICLNRPCEVVAFWEGVMEVLRLGNVVLYFPGCPCPLVASGSVGHHLPVDLIESLGRPQV